ncbi:hypothetical protein GYMLUDRAFT_158432 [Collybiopsis luxurians FD-317 M1]|nr:hypothetical protein GYMLUDRAFT_158432 [Collybiopsis luxurians FD-317 M1]
MISRWFHYEQQILAWPTFWTTNHTLGWVRLLRVNGTSYNWLGAPADLNLSDNAKLNNATLDGYQVTPTHSILSLTAGSLAINVTFLSPIEPENLVLQSFPFTYIHLEASLTDGKPHSLQVYHDIGGEWVSSNILNVIQWNTMVGTSIIHHEAQRSPFQYMTKTNNMAEDDGMIYHVTNAGTRVTYQIGQNTIICTAFLNNATLTNSQDTDFLQLLSCLPIFTFSQDLETITSASSPVVWGIGLVQSPDIIYTTTAGNQNHQPYFFTKYSDILTAVCNPPCLSPKLCLIYSLWLHADVRFHEQCLEHSPAGNCLG